MSKAKSQHHVGRLIFYEDFFFTINFQKEKANTLTLLIIFKVKLGIRIVHCSGVLYIVASARNDLIIWIQDGTTKI